MSRPADADLRGALEACLAGRLGRPVTVAGLARRPAPCASSFALEDLDVSVTGGPVLRLVFKDFDPDALFGAGRAARPAFLHDPGREIEVYREILDPGELGTATFYGGVRDPAAGRHWLFVERVDGDELYKLGDFDAWLDAARWLARFHTRFAGAADEPAGRVPLLRHDTDFYRLWPDRAAAVLRARGESADQCRWVERLGGRYDRVVDRLAALPATVVHGDFYPSNVLIRRGGDGPRVCPIDWEQAAVGPGLGDLAALTAGKWDPDRRSELALAYHRALPPDGRPAAEEFLRDLDACRLHVAVQWLGWSADWTPPPDQANDWFAEARAAADRLGIA